jgi:hypothetical protein
MEVCDGILHFVDYFFALPVWLWRAELRTVRKKIGTTSSDLPLFGQEQDEKESVATPAKVTPRLRRRRTAHDWFSSLPADYYGLAIICCVWLIWFTIANADELSSTEIFSWIGYTFGTVLSLVTIGRVVRLLQQIRDVGVQIRDVGVSISNKLSDRNNPALSPGKPDESDSPGPRTGDKS